MDAATAHDKEVVVYHVPKDSLREGSTLDADPRFPAVDVVLRRDYDALREKLNAAHAYRTYERSDFCKLVAAAHEYEAALLQAREQIERQAAHVGRLRDVCHRYDAALVRISAGSRPDGTYNLSREACEQLAREALDVYPS